MELALNSAEGPEAQWRAGFRSRIRKALDFLRGQNAFGKTQCRHFNAFNQTYVNNPSFRREVGKLSPFEMEVLCISSTLSQLEADSGHFTANEVTQALAFNIQDHRRGEVRDKILSDGHNNLPRLYRDATRERKSPILCIRHSCQLTVFRHNTGRGRPDQRHPKTDQRIFEQPCCSKTSRNSEP